jgi:hypothetical protein
MLNFTRKHQTVLQSGYTILHSHQWLFLLNLLKAWTKEDGGWERWAEEAKSLRSMWVEKRKQMSQVYRVAQEKRILGAFPDLGL